MSNVTACLLKHFGAKSPIEAYREDMAGDAKELIAAGMDADAAWKQVTQAKLAELRAEHARITGAVSDAYAKTAAGKMARAGKADEATTSEPESVPAQAAIVASSERRKPHAAPAEKPRVFKTRKNAIVERDRLGNEHKLQKIKGGFILRRKTDKEMAAEARAGRRLASGAASGLRRSLLATIAAGGGLNISERPDTIGEGNRNVGGRMVFTRAGKTINQWAEALAESGFIPPSEAESDDGVRWLQDAIGEEFAGRREHFAMSDEERMGEAQRAAQGEEPAPNDDPFGPLADFDLEELSADGYAAASPEVQALTEQVLAAADEAGIDIEALREDAARLTEGLSDDDYHAQLQAATRAAIAQTRADAARRDAGADQAGERDSGASAGTRGDEGAASEGLTLEAQDAQSLREKTNREAAAKAADAKQKADEQRRLEREAIDRETRDRARQDASAENFQLGQGANDALAGQGSIFDVPAEAVAPLSKTNREVEAGDDEVSESSLLDADASRVLVKETVRERPTKRQNASPYARFAAGEYVISVQQFPHGPGAVLHVVRHVGDIRSVERAPNEMLEDPAFSSLNDKARDLFARERAGQSSIFDAAPQAEPEAARLEREGWSRQESTRPAAEHRKTETAKNAEARYADARRLGREASERGEPRDPPQAFTSVEKQVWRAGWDAGKATKFAPQVEPKTQRAKADTQPAPDGETAALESEAAAPAKADTDDVGENLRYNRRNVSRGGLVWDDVGAAAGQRSVFDEPKFSIAAQPAKSLAEVRKSWADAGIESTVSEKDGTIELGRIVVPKDARGGGIGTRAMRELTGYADATGQRIVLTPETSFGATSVARLTAFYKRLGFKPNKGRSRDFTTRAGMIREPMGDAGNAALYSRTGDAVNAWAAIASNPDAFQYSPSDANDPAQIAEDAGVQLSVQKEPGPIGRDVEAAWRIYPLDVNGNAERTKPGYLIHYKGGRVELNVAGFTEGDAGSAAYAIAGNYAHNNGLKFVGDRFGLSDAGVERRLENMISLALKFGTTDFMQPAAEQQVKLGLKWKDGDFEHNLSQMLAASLDAIKAKFPAITEYTYDPDTDAIKSDVSGVALDERGRARLVADARAAGVRAGNATVTRAVITNTILQSKDGQARRRLLESIGRIAREPLDTKGVLAGLLYSRTGDEANALKALSDNDELFALPKSTKDTVEGIAADIDPQIKVTAHPAEGLDRYTLTMPDGKTAELFVRTPGEFGPHSYGTAREGEPAETVRPGEDQYNMRGLDDVWINVSRLEPGGGGARIYAIAGDFAHNTGRVFIGDPAGVSPIAKRRRSEAMLSSALRWGTTEHLAPHPMQVRGDKSIGVPPLRWVEGDDLGNIRNLIDVNLKALDNAFPSAKQIEFDVATGQFRNAVNGRPLDRLALRERVRAMRSSGASGASMGEAGGNTIARGAVWRALLREAGGTGETGGRRDGLLARLARLGSDAPQAVSKLFARGEGKSTAQALRSALESEFGADTISTLERAGLLTIADKPAANMPQEAAGVTEGGRVGLFADNTAPGSTAVAYHEALHATLRASIGDAAYDALMARMPMLVLGNKAFFAEANKRIPANTPASVRAEEQASYAVEAYQKNREAMPAGVRKWVADFIAAFKAGLAKALQAAGVGLKLRVTLLSDAAVLRVLARDGLRAMARGQMGAQLRTAYSQEGEGDGFWDRIGKRGRVDRPSAAGVADIILAKTKRRRGAYAGNQPGRAGTGLEPIRFGDRIGGWSDFVSLAVDQGGDGNDGIAMFVVPSKLLERATADERADFGWYQRNFVLRYELIGSRDGGVEPSISAASPGMPSFDESEGAFAPTGQMDRFGHEHYRADLGFAASKDYLSEALRRFALHAGYTPRIVYSRETGASVRGELRGVSAEQIEAKFSRAERAYDQRAENTPAEVKAAKAAIARIEAAGGVTSADDLRAVLRVSGYSQWAQSALVGNVDATRALRRDLDAAFEHRAARHDWTRPIVNAQGVVTFHDLGRDPQAALDALTAIADRYGAPIAARGHQMEVAAALRAAGFVGYSGMQERAGRAKDALIHWIRPAGGIGENTPLFSVKPDAFDATNPDIRYSIAGNQARASWDAPEESRFDSMVYKLQDKQIDTKRVVEAIRKASASLADQANVYLQEELFHGRVAKRTQDFVDLELRPAIVQMQMRGLKVEQLDEYLHARHAEEANELIADRNPDIQDAGSGMSTADARAYLAGLGQTQKRHLEAVAAKIDDIIKGTRDLYAAYGLESADTLNGWAKMFKHYVPLMREDHDGGMGIGQGFSIKGRETKSRTGSANAKVIDILANIALQRERVIVRGEKNRVSNALVGLAEANPNPDFWSVGTPPPVKVYNEKTNQVEDKVDPLFKSRDNVIVAKVLTPSGEVVEKAVMFNESNDRALRMSKSLKNMDTPQLEGLLGNSAKITRYFSAINTQYNPVFGVVNLVRDFQGAILNLSSTPLAGHSKTIAGHTLSALRGVYLDARAARDGKNPSSAWAALWDEFQNEGGQTGYRDLFRTSTDRADAIKRELDPTKWMESGLGKFFTAGGALKVPFAVAQKGATGIFGWLSDYNLAMENAVRLAAYKTGLEQGLSKQHAASIGKNLTVNFNRKGQVGQQAGALYAFFNASMQGSARIAQTLFTMEGSDPSTIRLSKAGKKIVYGGILLGTVQALALAAAGFDDEEPPEFVRERSLIIPTGGKNYITIPMPLGLHILPNLGRIPTEFVLGGFKKPVDHIVKMLALFIDAFNPVGGGASLVQTISPTAIDPIVALAENRDWTGKPIARTAYNPATPGHKLTRDTASAPAKFLSEAINFLSGGTDYVKGVFSPTPDQIDFLWGQVTGGVGRELNKADQTVTSLISGESLPPYKVPLIGRFYGNSDSQSSQANSFYSSLNQINEHEAEVKGLRKDGKGLEAARYIRENPESMLISAANAAERRVRELRTMKRDMIARNAPSTQIVAIEHQISARMQAFNELVKRLREKKAA